MLMNKWCITRYTFYLEDVYYNDFEILQEFFLCREYVVYFFYVDISILYKLQQVI